MQHFVNHQGIIRYIIGIDYIALQQNRLRWWGHVLHKDDDWMKK